MSEAEPSNPQVVNQSQLEALQRQVDELRQEKEERQRQEAEKIQKEWELLSEQRTQAASLLKESISPEQSTDTSFVSHVQSVASSLTSSEVQSPEEIAAAKLHIQLLQQVKSARESESKLRLELEEQRKKKETLPVPVPEPQTTIRSGVAAKMASVVGTKRSSALLVLSSSQQPKRSTSGVQVQPIEEGEENTVHDVSRLPGGIQSFRGEAAERLRRELQMSPQDHHNALTGISFSQTQQGRSVFEEPETLKILETVQNVPSQIRNGISSRAVIQSKTL